MRWYNNQSGTANVGMIPLPYSTVVTWGVAITALGSPSSAAAWGDSGGIRTAETSSRRPLVLGRLTRGLVGFLGGASTGNIGGEAAPGIHLTRRRTHPNPGGMPHEEKLLQYQNRPKSHNPEAFQRLGGSSSSVWQYQQQQQ